MRHFVGDDAAGVWAWPTRAAEGLAAVDHGWERVTTWLGGQFGVEVLHQTTGSGDTMHDWLQFATIVAVSLVLAIVWSLFERGTGYPRLGRWLHLMARWYLALWLIVYGAIKLYAGQFPEPGLGRLTREIGQTSPMGLVWTFLGASQPYEGLSGVLELLAGLLLFHRRTALLGCCVAVGVMGNVVALNWLYDVPVKLFSTHLLLFAVFLTAPWWPRLWALLVSNRASAPVDLRVVHSRWATILMTGFGLLWVGTTLVTTHWENAARLQQVAAQRVRPALYGVWDVETMQRDDQPIVAGDASRWRFLAIDSGGTAWGKTVAGDALKFDYTEDIAAGTITLRAKGDGGTAETWTFTRGETQVDVPDPEPRTVADFSRTVKQTRATLLLRGTAGGHRLELAARQRVFPLHRGLHLVQELPFNR